jgi:ribonuclease HI
MINNRTCGTTIQNNITTTTDTQPQEIPIAILQYNINKNSITTNSILNDPTTEKYSILMLQEIYWSTYTDSPPLHHSWTLITPVKEQDANTSPRSVIYINKRLIPSTSFTPIHFPSTDIIGVAINLPEQASILIINIYNPSNSPVFTILGDYLKNHLQANTYDSIIIGGDFNLHHPLWNPPHYDKHDANADNLIETMAELHLRLLIPPGTITFPRAKTAIDLVWGNARAEHTLLKCKIAQKNDHGSDHLPIEIALNLSLNPNLIVNKLTHSFSKADWDTVRTKMEELLPQTPALEQVTANEIDTYTESLVQAIQQTINETIPTCTLTPFSKRWWNDDLSSLRKEANKLRNNSRKSRNIDDIQLWKDKLKEYRKEVRQAKRDTWRQFVSQADERSIWKVNKYISSLPTTNYIPGLENGTAISDEQKSTVFKHSFFPPLPLAELNDIPGTVYPHPVPFSPIITEAQVKRAIDRLAPNKAPGPDTIPNSVLKKCYPQLKEHLIFLAQASLQTGHFPTLFKETVTVIVRKPGKPDYTKAKAYRPIALESTIGKVLESIIAEAISYLCETHSLLPANHFGGRPNRSSDDAMLLLTEKIYEAWKEGKIFTMILLDVEGAFNNVHHERLIHNMRLRRIPNILTRWAYNFLSNRHTRLKFNDTISDLIQTPAGIPQGSPLSPIFYILYNSELLQAMWPCNHELGLGFIDNIAYGVKGKSAAENITCLNRIMQQAEIWRRRHGAKFESSKYELIHFSRKRLQDNTPIAINNSKINPTEYVRYLGVIFDRQLKFRQHLDKIVRTGTKHAAAIAGIAKNNWGPEFKYLRRLITAVTHPKTDYGAIVWHRPEDYGKSPIVQQLSKLSTIQRLAMKSILGCFKTTPTAALEWECNLLPPELRLKSKISSALIRLLALPDNHPIKPWLGNAHQRATAGKIRYESNLESLAHHYPALFSSKIEAIQPYILPPWQSTNIQCTTATTNKEETAKAHLEMLSKIETDSNTLIIYADGSGIANKIGAGIFSPTLNYQQQKPLKTNKNYSVYGAELQGALLAVNLTYRYYTQFRQSFIFIDNQATIKSVDCPQRKSGQTIINEIYQIGNAIMQDDPHFLIHIQWVPGHKNILGNEQADNIARAAAALATDEPSNLQSLKAAVSNNIRKDIHKTWHSHWKTSRTKYTNANQLRNLSKRTKAEPVKLYTNIESRKHVAWLARLRTGHCSLNKYLNRFNITDSPNCDMCHEAHETVEHYLLQCQLFDSERKELREKVGVMGMRKEKLLGDPKFIQHTLEFVEKTGRFTF